MVANVLVQHMGDDFYRLDHLLQRVHQGQSVMQGTAHVVRGGFWSRLLCSLFRFPKGGDNVPLTVSCKHGALTMDWVRHFNGHKMASQFLTRNTSLVEMLGPLALYLKAVEKHGGLEYQFGRVYCMGIPCPSWLSPRITAYEKAYQGRYRFYVSVTMPVVGFVIQYSGDLDLLVG